MKTILLSLLLTFSLYAQNNTSYEIKIYNTIFAALFPHQKITVWSDSKQKKESLLKALKNVIIVNDIRKAKVLFITKDENITSNAMKIVTNYKLLKRYKKNVICGFYWKKGRPNILFLKQNLQHYALTLPSSMKKYVEENP
jgi:hypothetical protein